MVFRRFRTGSTSSVKQSSVVTGTTRSKQVEAAIPLPVEIAGQWAWRVLAVVGVLVIFGLLIITLRDIVVPLMVAILVSALLMQLVNWLVRHRWPRGLAVALALVLTLTVVGGLVYLIVWQVRDGYPALEKRTLIAYDSFRDFIASPPLSIDATEFDNYVSDIAESLQADNSALVSGALSVGTTAGHAITGVLLVIFATIFILLDGKRIWLWVTRLFPRTARSAVAGAGERGWRTLATFVRVQILVAAVDAVGIGVGAAIIGAFTGGFPLLIPITIAVFLGSFIPVVGAVVSGALAAFVALIFLGPIPALIMLGVVLLVQQVEGHILQPLVMGSAVKVHPLAVVFAVAAGAGIAGISGALFAVPVVAVINVMVKYIASGHWRDPERPEAKGTAAHA